MNADIARRPWPRQPGYLVGEDGSILGPSGRLRRLHLGPRGYLTLGVSIAGRGLTLSAHVMVAESWHGPRPEGLEVAHRNGIRTDNRPANLRWATRKSNHADKVLHGTDVRGERHYGAALTEADVLAIKADYSAGTATQRDLARRYLVSQPTVSDVVCGRTWSHSQPVLKPPSAAERQVMRGEHNGRARFTEQDVRTIRVAHASATSTTAELSEQYGVSMSAIRHILKRRVWGHVQ